MPETMPEGLQERLNEDRPKRKPEKMIKMRFKNGVGAHRHVDAEGTPIWLKPGDVIELPERCVKPFADKFETMDEKTEAQKLADARKLIADHEAAETKKREELALKGHENDQKGEVKDGKATAQVKK